MYCSVHCFGDRVGRDCRASSKTLSWLPSSSERPQLCGVAVSWFSPVVPLLVCPSLCAPPCAPLRVRTTTISTYYTLLLPVRPCHTNKHPPNSALWLLRGFPLLRPSSCAPSCQENDKHLLFSPSAPASLSLQLAPCFLLLPPRCHSNKRLFPLSGSGTSKSVVLTPCSG